MREKIREKEKESFLFQNNDLIFDPNYDQGFWLNLHDESNADHWHQDSISGWKDERKKFFLLEKGEQEALKICIGFFLAGDTILNGELCEKVLDLVKNTQIKPFWYLQLSREVIHSITYRKMADSISDIKEINDILKIHIKKESVKEKIDYIKKYTNEDSLLIEIFAVFVCYEAILFSTSFLIFFVISSKYGKNKIPALTTANNYISIDENKHFIYNACILRKLINEIKIPESKEIIKNIFLKAVEIEKKYAKEMFQNIEIGFDEQKINNYVEFWANKSWSHIFLNEILFVGIENPYFKETMHLMSHQKVNTFEVQNTLYTTYSIGSLLSKDNINDVNKQVDELISNFEIYKFK